jgi:4-cresol dehydrogenase (hydroxylating)
MGVWLMPEPQVYMPLWLRVWRDDDLGPLIETARSLALDGTIRMVPQVLNTLCLGAVLSRREQWWTGTEPIPDAQIDRIARELEIGRWTMRFALYGDEPVVEHRFRKLKAAFERIPDAEISGTKHTPADFARLEHPADKIQAGIPNLGWNNMTGWYGGEEGGHIGFSPVSPLTARDGLELRDLLRRGIECAGLDYMAALLLVNARSFIHITMVIFDTKDEAQARGAYDVSKRLVVEAAKHGFGEYRAHLDFMDLAAEQYSFGNHVARRFNETIKDAIDPNGILSPGKQGIWPRSMRDGGAS